MGLCEEYLWGKCLLYRYTSGVAPVDLSQSVTQTTEVLQVTNTNGLKCKRNIDRALKGFHTCRERSWWLVRTVIWNYAFSILCRMEGHNPHYADESIIHEQNSSQNSKNPSYLTLRTTTALLLPAACSPRRVGPRQHLRWSWSLGGAPALVSATPPSSGKYRHTQEMWISDD